MGLVNLVLYGHDVNSDIVVVLPRVVLLFEVFEQRNEIVSALETAPIAHIEHIFAIYPAGQEFVDVSQVIAAFDAFKFQGVLVAVQIELWFVYPVGIGVLGVLIPQIDREVRSQRRH